jgi:hypothetical protein
MMNTEMHDLNNRFNSKMRSFRAIIDKFNEFNKGAHPAGTVAECRVKVPGTVRTGYSVACSFWVLHNTAGNIIQSS